MGTSLWYGSYTGGNHIFFSGTSERMRITASQVGIGTGLTLKLNQGFLDLSDSTSNSPIYLATMGTSLISVNNVAGQYTLKSAIGDTTIRATATKNYIYNLDQIIRQRLS